MSFWVKVINSKPSFQNINCQYNNSYYLWVYQRFRFHHGEISETIIWGSLLTLFQVSNIGLSYISKMVIFWGQIWRLFKWVTFYSADYVISKNWIEPKTKPLRQVKLVQIDDSLRLKSRLHTLFTLAFFKSLPSLVSKPN